MASSQILCSIVFWSFLFLFVSSSHSSSANSAGAPTVPASPVYTKKVALSLYYESMCPYCQRFIVKPLEDAVKSDLMTIVDLQLVPWGNAFLLPNNTVNCQHGEDECYLNIIQACAINIWPDVMKHFDLIKCIEEQNPTAPEVKWQLCTNKLKFPSQPIKDCYDSGRGRQLLLQFGNLTNHLEPAHQYVPWVLVDGTPLYDDYGNFVHYVCKAYKGDPLPKACNVHHINTISREKSVQSVCSAGLASASKGPAIVEMYAEPPPK